MRSEGCDATSHLQQPRSVVFLQINLPCSYHQKQILPNCTSACSLLISPNKWHPFSSHMAQLVCNANTQRTLALLIPEELVPALCLKAWCGATLCRYLAGLGQILKAFFWTEWWVKSGHTPRYQSLILPQFFFMLEEVQSLGCKGHDASCITLLAWNSIKGSHHTAIKYFQSANSLFCSYAVSSLSSVHNQQYLLQIPLTLTGTYCI